MNRASDLPARKGGAKALLLTVLGEFVLPNGGEAWTSTLVAAADALGIGEKNARQALARISDQGLISGERHGRSVRWALTQQGRHLLETGTHRIYSFGRADVEWDGQWLLAHCPVAESQRAARTELRTELGYLGFGELSPTLLVSPHVQQDEPLREVLERLALLDESTILWSKSVNGLEDHELATKAWDLDELGESYVDFTQAHEHVRLATPEEAFAALVGLVHEWRRFPFVDPELPTQLLPTDWVGNVAVALFHRQHALLTASAQEWFASHEQLVAARS